MDMPRHFTPVEKRNTLLNALGEALWGFQSALVASATVLTVLLIHLGATPRLIGVIPAIEGTLIVLPQVAGIWLFHASTNRRRDLVIWHLTLPIPMLLAIGVLILTPLRENASFMRGALLFMFAAFVAGIGAIVSVWMDWLADMFRPAIRGTAMGISFAASALVGVAGGVIAGAILGRWPGTVTYGVLYVVAAIVAAASFICFWYITDPPRTGAAATASPPPSPAETWERFRLSLRDLNFRRYIIGRGLAAAGFAITPFIALYYQSPDGGGMSSGSVVAAGSLMALGGAAGNLGFGRLGDRYGHRLGVIAGAALQVVTLAVMIATSGPWSCALVYFLAGICGSSAFVSHSNILYETCPHDHRLSHITLGNMVLALPFMLGGILSGQIAGLLGLKPLFVLCLILSLGAAAWLILRVRDPREKVGESPAVTS